MSTTNLPNSPDLVAAMKGPREPGFSVIIEGRAIPGLTMYEEGDEVCLILDGRMSINVPRERAYQVAWFAATALAIGAGYSHIGGETRDRPFAPRAMGISSMPTRGNEQESGRD